MTTHYIDIETALRHPIRPPEHLDAVSFQYRGVQVHVYGILHGLTGGTNKAYVEMVNRTIAAAPGLKFSEKKLGSLYKGLDVDMEDWREMPLKDAFLLGLSTCATPWRLAKLIGYSTKERFTKNDPFGKNNLRRLQDIGGSPVFHALDPLVRRNLAGFPGPAMYLKENLRRRKGSGRMQPPVFPDKSWEWLSFLEPYTNIPCRSIHMVEFATEWALQTGVQEISLFVGEIHNTDIAWFVQGGVCIFEEEDQAAIESIVHRARAWAQFRKTGKRSLSVLWYLGALSAGIALPVCFYIGLARYLLS